MILNLSCIVEGHGEEQAVPILLERIKQASDAALQLKVSPLRLPRQKLVRSGELEKGVRLAAFTVKPPRAVLILIDAEEDCAAELGPELLARAKQATPDVPIGVVLANRMYEAWFLAAIESLRGKRGLAGDVPPVEAPDTVRRPKKFLTRHMGGSRAYSSKPDQRAMTRVFDMEMARRRSPSFDKCWREIERLLAEASPQPGENGLQSG